MDSTTGDDTNTSTDTEGGDGQRETRETRGRRRTAVGVRCLKSEASCSSPQPLLVCGDSGECRDALSCTAASAQ